MGFCRFCTSITDYTSMTIFLTEAAMKESCTENLLSRGRTNHSIGERVVYLTCTHDGCNAKIRLLKKMDRNEFILQAAEGFDHHHNDLEIAPEKGLSEDQKRITLECYDRDCGVPKTVFQTDSMELKCFEIQK
jgi:hypothetical protein